MCCSASSHRIVHSDRESVTPPIVISSDSIASPGSVSGADGAAGATVGADAAGTGSADADASATGAISSGNGAISISAIASSGSSSTSFSTGPDEGSTTGRSITSIVSETVASADTAGPSPSPPKPNSGSSMSSSVGNAVDDTGGGRAAGSARRPRARVPRRA